MANRVKDLTGQTFHLLTVIGRDPTRQKRAFWICKCACGKTTSVAGNNIQGGGTKSCGCLTAHNNRRHGKALSPVYAVYKSMKARCERPTHKAWKQYGALGVRVCERWASFEAFYRDMGDPPPGMSIDRIDPHGNYTPENCRWASVKTQARNKRNTIFVILDGERRPLSEWAERYGLPLRLVRGRLKQGWSLRDALTKKPAPKNRSGRAEVRPGP